MHSTIRNIDELRSAGFVAFCFSTPNAFDPLVNPPTLSTRYTLIPSTPICLRVLTTSPCEPCRSFLVFKKFPISHPHPFQVLSPLPMAAAPSFLRSGIAAVTRNYTVKEISRGCRENIQQRLWSPTSFN